MSVRVLVVDDSQDQRELLGALFVKAGCVVDEAKSTAEAVVHLSANTPEIAVVDLILEPGDSGVAACAAVRELAPSAAVVIASVLDVADYPEADARLPKPFTGAQVRALVARFGSRS